MISVIGLGNAASAIVDCFKDTPQYKVFKINTIIVNNVDGTNAASVNLYLNRALDPALGDLQIARAISVPANSNLVVISKETSFYMEEGDILKGNTTVNGDLTLLVSYEEIE